MYVTFKKPGNIPHAMYVALTGTPGTGKTTAAAILARRGHATVTLEELAARHGALKVKGEEKEVDTVKLAAEASEPADTTIVVGHLAHFVPNTVCIILRCHPNGIKERLSPRNYSKEKLLENMEAEAVDIILTEALEAWENVYEIDTTDLEPEAVADAIERIMNGDCVEYSPGRIDWSGAVMDWY
jgi:adenylate kinase